MSPSTFAFGDLTLSDEPARLARALCADANLTATQLYCKWEAWALSHNKSSDVPSSSDLDHLAAHIRSDAAKSKSKAKNNPPTPATRSTTPRPARQAGLVYTPVPTPTRVNVDDFFSYFDDPDVPAPQNQKEHHHHPPAPMDLEPSGPHQLGEKPVPELPDLVPDPSDAQDDDLVLAGASVGQPRQLVLAGDAEPDPTYAGRDGSGRVEAAFNGGADLDNLSSDRPPVALRQLTAAEDNPRYMNDAVPAKIEAVRSRVRELGERILKRVKDLRADGEQLPKLSPESFFVRSPDVVLAVGRIRVELDETDGVTGGRINANSVVLESEDGNMVKLNLSRVHENKQPLFLNPGMIVVVEGVNTNGRCIQVHAIYDNAMALPTAARAKKEEVAADDDADEILPDGAQPKEEPFASVMFAAGPYTTSANLNYEPLDDLLAVVERARPDAVFLVGPFVDAGHSHISAATPVPFEQIFETRVMARLRKAVAAMSSDGPRTQFVLIPSLSDVHHDFVCPQPAFRTPPGQARDARISFVTNPSVMELSNEGGGHVASVGISALPSLQDISGDCICWNKGDRFSAIASHMLRQCSFYPTFPASSAVPLDGSLLDGIALLDMGRTPTVDVLVTPSKLKAFTKTVDGGAVTVNPGLLCRGSSGGTYAELRIPLYDASSQRPLNANEDRLKASIVRL